MARLPQPGGDTGNWGTILNDYLSQALKSDGTIKNDAVNAASIVDGSISEVLLDANVQSKLNAAATPDATSSVKGKIQLAGDLTGTSASPALVNVVTAGSAGSATSVPAITYDAKGRITAVAPATIQIAQSQVTNLATDLAAKAVDDGVVHNTSDEVIAGVKTFTSAPKLTASSTSGHVWTATGTDGSGGWAAASGGASTASTDLGSLYQPMTDIISTSALTTDQYVSALPGDYTNAWGTIWNASSFNLQGQNWVAVNSGNVAAGCQNDSNGRRVGSNVLGSVIDFEFIFTGDKLDINFQAFGPFDTQVYIEDEGRMKKAKALPMAGNINGFAFRSLRFSEIATRRIRIVLPAVYFIQINHEQSAIVRRSADRPLLLTTGDSYFESSGALNDGSTRSFATFGMVDQIIESTGFAVARLGQGGSGYFNNGAGVATDTAGPNNVTRFFSPDRVSTMTQFLGSTAKPVALLINGSINDGELSGDGVTASASGMQARCLAGWQAINSVDSLCSIIQIGPEPINDSQANVNGVHSINRTGQMNAVGIHPQAIGFVDAGNPTSPFWSGTGYDDSPTTSQQAYMIGHDQIHPNWYGHKHYGSQIAAAMKTMKVPTVRAQRTQ